MEERLLPVNATLGLTMASGVGPAPLAEAGYLLVGIEVPVICRSQAIVTVDLVFLRGETSHFLLCEAKSGAHVDEEQAKRYSDIDPLNVVRATGATLTQRMRPSAEVMYVCLEDHVSSIRTGLAAAGVNYPILAVGSTTVTLTDIPATTSDELRTALGGGTVELGGPPPRVIPLDHDSDEAVIEPFVMAQLVAELSNRCPSITVGTLTELSGRHIAVFGRRARNVLIKKVGRVCRSIAKNDPSTFKFQPAVGNQDAVVHILRTPETNDRRGRTQGYQALARRPGTRRRRPSTDPRQLDLFSELDIEDDGGSRDDG